MSEEQREKTPSNAAKKLARLVAVQALYRASFEEESLADILKASLEEASSFWGEEGDDKLRAQPDAETFRAIVRGVQEHRADLEPMIAGALSEKLTFARMEALLRAVFLAGAYELLHRGDVPAGVIISDYVDVARAFFDAKEPAMVNAVLDKLAGKLRG